MKVIARNKELKDIISNMNIEDVETIYNTMQNSSAESFKEFSGLNLGMGLGYNIGGLLGAIVIPAGVIPSMLLFLGTGHTLLSIISRISGNKRENCEADFERTNEIVQECFGANDLGELSFGTQVGLYVNSKRRMRKEKKSKVKRK